MEREEAHKQIDIQCSEGRHGIVEEIYNDFEEIQNTISIKDVKSLDSLHYKLISLNFIHIIIICILLYNKT